MHRRQKQRPCALRNVSSLPPSLTAPRQSTSSPVPQLSRDSSSIPNRPLRRQKKATIFAPTQLFLHTSIKHSQFAQSTPPSASTSSITSTSTPHPPTLLSHSALLLQRQRHRTSTSLFALSRASLAIVRKTGTPDDSTSIPPHQPAPFQGSVDDHEDDLIPSTPPPSGSSRSLQPSLKHSRTTSATSTSTSSLPPRPSTPPQPTPQSVEHGLFESLLTIPTEPIGDIDLTFQNSLSLSKLEKFRLLRLAYNGINLNPHRVSKHFRLSLDALTITSRDVLHDQLLEVYQAQHGKVRLKGGTRLYNLAPIQPIPHQDESVVQTSTRSIHTELMPIDKAGELAKNFLYDQSTMRPGYNLHPTLPPDPSTLDTTKVHIPDQSTQPHVPNWKEKKKHHHTHSSNIFQQAQLGVVDPKSGPRERFAHNSVVTGSISQHSKTIHNEHFDWSTKQFRPPATLDEIEGEFSASAPDLSHIAKMADTLVGPGIKAHSGFSVWSGTVVDNQERFQGSLLSALTLARTGNHTAQQLLQHLAITLRDYGRFKSLPQHSEFFVPHYTPTDSATVSGPDALQDANSINLISKFSSRKQRQIVTMLELISSHLSPKTNQVFFQDQYIARRLDALTTFVLEHPNVANLSKLTRAYTLAVTQYNITPTPRLHSAVLLANHYLAITKSNTDSQNTDRSLYSKLNHHITPSSFMTTHSKHQMTHDMVQQQIKHKDGSITTTMTHRDTNYGTPQNPLKIPGSINIHDVPELGKDYALPAHMFTLEAFCHDAIGIRKLYQYYTKFAKSKSQFPGKARQKLSSNHIALLPPTFSHFIHLLTSPLVFGNFTTKVYSSATQAFVDTQNTSEITPGTYLGVYHVAPEGSSTSIRGNNQAPLLSHTHHHVVSIDLHRCLHDQEYALINLAYIFADVLDSSTASSKHSVTSLQDISILPLHIPSPIGHLSNTHLFLHQIDAELLHDHPSTEVTHSQPKLDSVAYLSALTPSLDRFGAPLFSQRDELARHGTMLFSFKYRWLQSVWEAMRFEHVHSGAGAGSALNAEPSNLASRVGDLQQLPAHHKSKHLLNVPDEEFELAEFKRNNPFKSYDKLHNPQQYEKDYPTFRDEHEWGDYEVESDDVEIDEDNMLKAFRRVKQAHKDGTPAPADTDNDDDDDDDINGGNDDSDDEKGEALRKRYFNSVGKTVKGKKVDLNYDALLESNTGQDDIALQDAEELIGSYRYFKTVEINDDPLLSKYRQSLHDARSLLPTPSIYTLDFTRALIDVGIYHEMYLVGNDVTTESGELISNTFTKLGWSDSALSLLSSTTQPIYTVFNSSTEMSVAKYNVHAANRVKLHPTVSSLRILADEEHKRTGSRELNEQTIAKHHVRIADPFLGDYPARAEAISFLKIDPSFIQSSTVSMEGKRKLDGLPSQLLFTGIEEGDSSYRDLHIPLMTQNFVHNIRTVITSLGNLNETQLAEIMVSVVLPQKFKLYQQSPELYDLAQLEQEANQAPLCATHLNHILSHVLQQEGVLDNLNLHIKPSVKFPTQYHTESFLAAANVEHERYGLRVPTLASHEAAVLQKLDDLAVNLIHSGGSLDKAREISKLRTSIRDVIMKRLQQKLDIFHAAIKSHRGKLKAVGLVPEILADSQSSRQYSKPFQSFVPQSPNSHHSTDCDQVLDLLFRQSPLGRHLVQQSIKTQPAYDELMNNTQMKKHLSSYNAATQSQQQEREEQQESPDGIAASNPVRQTIAQRIKHLQTLTDHAQLDPQLMITRLEQEQPLFKLLQPNFMAPTTPVNPSLESLLPITSQSSYFVPIGIGKDTPKPTVEQLSILNKGSTEFPSLSAGLLSVENHINTGNYRGALDAVVRTLMRYDLHRKLKIEHLKKTNQYTLTNRPSRTFPFPQLLSYGFLLGQSLGDWSTSTWLIQFIRNFDYTPPLSRITQLAKSVDKALALPTTPATIDPLSDDGKVHFVTVDTIQRLRASIGKKLWLTTKSTVVHTKTMTLDAHFVTTILPLFHSLDDIMQLYFEALCWPVNVNTRFFSCFQQQIQLVASHQKHLISKEHLKQYNVLQNYIQFVMQRVFSTQFRIYQALQTDNMDLISTLQQIRVDQGLHLAQSSGDVTAALRIITDLQAQSKPVTSSHWAFALGAIVSKWKRGNAQRHEANQSGGIGEGQSAAVAVSDPFKDSRFHYTLTREQQQDAILAHRIFATCILEDKLEDHHLWINMLRLATLTHDTPQVLSITQFLFALNGIQHNTMLPYHANTAHVPKHWGQDKFAIYNVTWQALDDLEAIAELREQGNLTKVQASGDAGDFEDNRASKSKGNTWSFSDQLSKRILQSYKHRTKPINQKNLWNMLDLQWTVQDVLGPFDIKSFSQAPTPSSTSAVPSINTLFGYTLPWSLLDRLRLQSGLDTFQHFLTLHYGRLQQQKVTVPIKPDQLQPLPPTISPTERVLTPNYTSLLPEQQQLPNLPQFNVSLSPPVASNIPRNLLEQYQLESLPNHYATVQDFTDIPTAFPHYSFANLNVPPIPAEVSTHTSHIGSINQHPMFSLFSPIHPSVVSSSAPVPTPEMLNIALPSLAKISPMHSIMSLLWTINKLHSNLSTALPKNLRVLDAETHKPPISPLHIISDIHHQFVSKNGAVSNKVSTPPTRTPAPKSGHNSGSDDSDLEPYDDLSEDDVFNDDDEMTFTASKVVSTSYQRTLQLPDSQFVLSSLPNHIAQNVPQSEQSRLIHLARTNNEIKLNGYDSEDVAGLVLSTARSLYSSGYYGFAVAAFNLGPPSQDKDALVGQRYTEGFREPQLPSFSSIQLNNSHDTTHTVSLDIRNMDPLHGALYARAQLQPIIQTVLAQMLEHHQQTQTPGLAAASATTPATSTDSPQAPGDPAPAASVSSILAAMKEQTALTSYNPFNCPGLVISTGDYINPDRVLQESFLYHFNAEFNPKSASHTPVVVDMLYSDNTTSTSYQPHLLYPGMEPDKRIPFDQLYQYLFDSNNTGQLVITPYTITTIAFNMFVQLVPEASAIHNSTSASDSDGVIKAADHDHLRRLGEMDMVNILVNQFYADAESIAPSGPKTQPNIHSWWKNSSHTNSASPSILSSSLQLLHPSTTTPRSDVPDFRTLSPIVQYHWIPPQFQDWLQLINKQTPNQNNHKGTNSRKNVAMPTRFADAPPPPSRSAQPSEKKFADAPPPPSRSAQPSEKKFADAAPPPRHGPRFPAASASQAPQPPATVSPQHKNQQHARATAPPPAQPQLQSKSQPYFGRDNSTTH